MSKKYLKENEEEYKDKEDKINNKSGTLAHMINASRAFRNIPPELIFDNSPIDERKDKN